MNHKEPSKKIEALFNEGLMNTAKKLVERMPHFSRKDQQKKFEKNLQWIMNSKYGCKVLPFVGMGVTRGVGSDCYPGTIVAVAEDFSYIAVTEDSHDFVVTEKAKPGEMYNKGYDVYTTNWRAHRTLYTLRKDGRWVREGSGINDSCSAVGIGHRRYYQDPSF